MLYTVRVFALFPELCGFKTRGGRWRAAVPPPSQLDLFAIFQPTHFCTLPPPPCRAVTDYVDAPAGDEIELESKRLQLEQKRVFFNLKQNSRGKFLKVWCGQRHFLFSTMPLP